MTRLWTLNRTSKMKRRSLWPWTKKLWKVLSSQVHYYSWFHQERILNDNIKQWNYLWRVKKSPRTHLKITLVEFVQGWLMRKHYCQRTFAFCTGTWCSRICCIAAIDLNSRRKKKLLFPNGCGQQCPLSKSNKNFWSV